MTKILKTFRCDRGLLDEVESYSTKHRTTTSNIIRLALFSYLANQMKKDIAKNLYE